MATAKDTPSVDRDQYVLVTINVFPEDGMFTAICPELDVASCGDTRQEALDNAQDAVALYLKTITDAGELDMVLKERGLTIRTGSPAKIEVEVAASSSTMATLVPV